MKKIPFVGVGLALAFLIVIVIAADKKQLTLAEANATIQELTKQIDSLQAKMKTMEQRLAKAEQSPTAPADTAAPLTGEPVFVVPRALKQPNPLENNFADPANPPKIWGEGECNGWKFYTIPLAARQGITAMQLPPGN